MRNVFFVLFALAILAFPGVAGAQAAADFECRNENVQGDDLYVRDTQYRTDQGYAYVETQLDPTGITVFGAPAIYLSRSRAEFEEVLTAIVIGSYDDVIRAAIVADEGIHSCDSRSDVCNIDPMGSRGLQSNLEIRRLDSTRISLRCLYIL